MEDFVIVIRTVERERREGKVWQRDSTHTHKGDRILQLKKECLLCTVLCVCTVYVVMAHVSVFQKCCMNTAKVLHYIFTLQYCY